MARHLPLPPPHPRALPRRLVRALPNRGRRRRLARRALPRAHLPHRHEPRGRRPAPRAHRWGSRVDGELRFRGLSGVPVHHGRNRCGDEHRELAACVSAPVPFVRHIKRLGGGVANELLVMYRVVSMMGLMVVIWAVVPRHRIK